MESLVSDDGVVLTHRVARYDPIVTLTDRKKASAFLQFAMINATEDDMTRLAQAFLGEEDYATWATFTNYQRGGASLCPKNVAEVDIRIYRLMELADAIHDFADERPRKGQAMTEAMKARNERHRERIAADLGVEFPDEIQDASIVADKAEFIKRMGENSDLTFGGVPVTNPLGGRDFTTGLYEHTAGTDPVATWRTSGACRHVDLFCSTALGTPIVHVIKVAEIRGHVATVFRTTSPEFVVDQNAFPRQQDIPADRPAGHLMAWMLGATNLCDEVASLFLLNDSKVFDPFKGKVATTERIAKFNERVGSWRILSCDASVYDNAQNVDYMSPHGATEDVFHPDALVHFRFDRDPTPASYGYTIESTVSPVDVFEPHLGRTEYSRDVESWRYTDRDTGREGVEVHDKVSLLPFFGNYVHRGLNCAAPLALKRASDWGQVEHCKKHDLIFVTSDILAAEYAMYRGAALLFLKTYDYVKRGKTFNFVHYSFVLSRATTCPQEAAPIPTVSAWGGGSRFVFPVLAAVAVVAMALMQSVV